MIDKERIARSVEYSDGYYLLPRRDPKLPFQEKDHTDLEYDACKELVDEGRAKWLLTTDRLAPGIQIISDGKD